MTNNVQWKMRTLYNHQSYFRWFYNIVYHSCQQCLAMIPITTSIHYWTTINDHAMIVYDHPSRQLFHYYWIAHGSWLIRRSFHCRQTGLLLTDHGYHLLSMTHEWTVIHNGPLLSIPWMGMVMKHNIDCSWIDVVPPLWTIGWLISVHYC